MKIFGIKKPKIINPNMKILFWPGVSFLLLVTLFIGLFKTVYPRIVTLYSEIKKVEQENQVLSEKVEILREIQTENLPVAGVTSSALPNRNPALLMISQIKSESQISEVALGGFSVGSSNSQENMTALPIDFEITAQNIGDLLNFADSTNSLAPVSRVNSVVIRQNQAQDGVTGEVKLTTYWSDFPQELPPINEPVSELTQQERNMLVNLSNLKMPTFVTLSPSERSNRTNPFE